MAALKDPKGNPLKIVLLQILEADVQGPILLRVRRDHEQIDLADERRNKFLVVWVSEDQVLGELQLNDLYEDFEKVKEQAAIRESAKVELDHQIAAISHEMTALTEENRVKTEALRVLQKERDPHRLEVLVQVRTLKLEDEMLRARAEAAELRSEVAELRAAKKRLKAANEKLKEQVGR